ncbi:MAG: metallophosphoesterase [Candidatus Marsarchaeota archaeon]|nr:metallophosphoesterase [Candidatus Marsarchaeota archaeon]
MEYLEDRIKFAFDECAAIVRPTGSKKNFLVVGDLHIGTERKFRDRGVHVYEAVDTVASRIMKLAEEFAFKDIIILGDVKDSILYPEKPERDEIKRFFSALKSFDITITTGNHDPHLEEVVDCNMAEELVIGDFAFLHGHRWPSQKAMMAEYILVGHNHVAISLSDRYGGIYRQKGWLVSKINKKRAAGKYNDYNEDAKLVVLPAFNDLILGMPVNEVLNNKENLNPLLRNGIFDYNKAKVYSLRGDLVGTVKELSKIKIEKKKEDKTRKIRKND